MRDYMVLRAGTTEELREQVLVLASSGWSVQGGISSYTEEEYAYEDGTRHNVYFTQAMVRV